MDNLALTDYGICSMDTVRIWNNANQLKALTGLEKVEAEEIVHGFRKELEALGHYPEGGNGRPAKHGPEGVFLLLMMYYRHYITLEALGALFDLSDSNVKRWISESEKALRDTLEKKSLSHLLPKLPPRISGKPFPPREKSISMALNKLCGDQ